MNQTLLEDWSLIAIVTSGIIFGLSFVFYTYDFAVRTSGQGNTANARKTQNIATALAWLAFIVIVLGIVLRGIAAGRAPWSNMFEFSTTAVAVVAGVWLFANFWKDLRFTGMFMTFFCLVIVMLATLLWYTAVKPLPPSLASAWLVFHVILAIGGTGFFALGAVLSGLQMVQAKREKKPVEQRRKNQYLDQLADAEKLETLAFRLNVVGFVLWTFTLIFGAIWAQKAWGRFWGWDVKETWTLIIWVVYAAYLHARSTRGWRGTPAAILALAGFACVLFNFGVVNVFFHGMHSYSGLS